MAVYYWGAFVSKDNMHWIEYCLITSYIWELEDTKVYLSLIYLLNPLNILVKFRSQEGALEIKDYKGSGVVFELQREI